MRIRITRRFNRRRVWIEPGTELDVPEDQAQRYISRGLAVPQQLVAFPSLSVAVDSELDQSTDGQLPQE